MDEGWSYSTVFLADPGSISRARAFVSAHLATHELTYLDDDVRLVVSELATNALLHANTKFTVTLEGSVSTVRLRVLDASAARPLLGIASATDAGGRGLTIVEAVSRSWGVLYHDNGGKSVWAEFTAPPWHDL